MPPTNPPPRPPSPPRIPSPPTLRHAPTPRLPLRMTPDMVQNLKERREAEKMEQVEWDKGEEERLSRIRAMVGRSRDRDGGVLGGEGQEGREKGKAKVATNAVGKGQGGGYGGDDDEAEAEAEAGAGLGLGFGSGFRGVGGSGSGGGGGAPASAWIERGGPRRKRMKIVATGPMMGTAGKSAGGGGGRACEKEGEQQGEGKFGDRFRVSGDTAAWMNGVGGGGKGPRGGLTK